MEGEVGRMQLMNGNEVVIDAPVHHIGHGTLFYVRTPGGYNTEVFVSDKDMHVIEWNVKDKDNEDNLPELTFPCFFKSKKAIFFSNGVGGMDKLVTLKD